MCIIDSPQSKNKRKADAGVQPLLVRILLTYDVGNPLILYWVRVILQVARLFFLMFVCVSMCGYPLGPMSYLYRFPPHFHCPVLSEPSCDT